MSTLSLPSLNMVKTAAVIGLGLLCGIAGFVHPALSIAVLLNVIFFLWLVKSPILCWKFLILHSLVFTCLIPEKIGILLGWQLFPAFFVGTAFLAYSSRSSAKIPSGLLNAMTLFLFWAFATTLLAYNHSAAIKETVRYVLSFVLFWIYSCILDKNQTRPMFRWWTYSMLAADFLLIAHLFLKLLGITPPLQGDFQGQISNLSWSLSAFLIIYGSILLSSWKRIHFSQVIFLLATFVSLVLTSGRTAYISTIIGFCILASTRLSKPGKRLLFIALLLSVITIFVIMALLYDNAWHGLVQNLSGRNLLWSAALKAANEHPIWGIGPGNWQDWLSANYVSLDFLLEDRSGNFFALVPSQQPGEAHNLFLTKIAEMGYPILPVLLILFAAWYQAARRNLKNLSGPAKPMAFGCFVAMISLAFYGLLENAPIIGRGRGPEAFLLWFIAAIPLTAKNWLQNFDADCFLPPFLQFKAGGSR